MASTANFAGQGNSGLQVGQSFGVINYNTPLPSDCHQIFRLTDGNRGGYEWYKDRIEERVAGTCEWFLKHPDYLSWKQRASGPLLVSADPGCGKSVLAKYLIDHELLGTVCYFFFKDEDQNTAKQALCALLHQLFAKHQSMLKYAKAKYDENGAKLVDLTHTLWDILRTVLHDPATGPVTFVLDALDECVLSDLGDLINMITRLYLRGDTKGTKIKFLLTSRPYQNVISKFWQLLDAFPTIRIPGEEHSNEIGAEVNCVIEHRVNQLSMKFRLSDKLTEHLRKRLKAIPHRTYLWTYLVFDILDSGFKKTHKGIEDSINGLPKSVNHAYEKILQKSTNLQNARKTFSIILAAARPLTVKEINIYFNIEPSPEAVLAEDLDMEDEDDFKDSLRNWCGLLISISDRKIYLLHQTAREFLVADQSVRPTRSLQWYASINLEEAHWLLAKICITNINSSHDNSNSFNDEGSCFGYSAIYWAEHFQYASTWQTPDWLHLGLELCRMTDSYIPYWFCVCWGYKQREPIRAHFSTLMIISYLGLENLVNMLLPMENMGGHEERRSTALHLASSQGHNGVVRLLLDHNANVDAHNEYKSTALHLASSGGHDRVVRLLLGYDANVDAHNENLQTALHLASHGGYDKIVRLLLDHNANVDAHEKYGGTALHLAAHEGHEGIVRLLLDHNANVDAHEKYGSTALHLAAHEGHEGVVRLLLDHNAHVDAYEKYGGTALHLASSKGHEGVVRLLLDHNANVDAHEEYRGTALHPASSKGHEGVVQLLLDHNANVNAHEEYGGTALHLASSKGHEGVVRLLLDHNANVDAHNGYRGTALHLASSKGHEGVVRLLLDHNANVDAHNEYRSTALHLASSKAYSGVVRLLLDNGAKVNTQDQMDETALLVASSTGHKATVRLLLDHSAELNTRDILGRTALYRASLGGHEELVRMLLDFGSDTNAQDYCGYTVLDIASSKGFSSIVRLLLDYGADMKTQNLSRNTALHTASKEGYETIVRLLLDYGGHVDTQNIFGKTALHIASEKKCEVIVRLLLEHGADVNLQAEDGCTALDRASEHDDKSISRLLLTHTANPSLAR